MAKPMPIEPAESDEAAVEAMDELIPITWPAALKVGPPELPGLMAASIWTALVTISCCYHRRGDRAVQGGHDAGGGGVVIAERVADGHHVLADGELVGVGEFHSLQVARRVVELDDRKIGGGIGADERGGIHVAVGKRHLNLLGAGDHVVVGDDVAFGVDDGAGALGGAVAQRGLDGDHGAGDIAGDGLPVGGFAAAGGGGPGAGLIRADVGQRIAGRQVIQPLVSAS